MSATAVDALTATILFKPITPAGELHKEFREPAWIADTVLREKCARPVDLQKRIDICWAKDTRELAAAYCFTNSSDRVSFHEVMVSAFAQRLSASAVKGNRDAFSDLQNSSTLAKPRAPASIHAP